MKYAVVIGTNGFKTHVKDFKIVKVYKELGFKVNTKQLKNNLLIIIYCDDEFVLKGVFGSKALHARQVIKACDRAYLFGMCYGFKGVKPGDYVLPNRFVAVKEAGSEYSVTKQLKDLPMTDEVKIENIINPLFENEDGVRVHVGAKVITHSFGIFTPGNVKGLKSFVGGEMESYYIASIAQKLKKPFGCLLICTDNELHDVSEELKRRTKIIIELVKKSDKDDLKALVPYDISKFTIDDYVKLYSKLKARLQRYEDLLNVYKKRLKKIRHEKSPIFKQALKNIYCNIIPKLINHLSA